MLSVLKYKLFADINIGEQFSFTSYVFRVYAIWDCTWIRNQWYEIEVTEIVFLITVLDSVFEPLFQKGVDIFQEISAKLEELKLLKKWIMMSKLEILILLSTP